MATPIPTGEGPSISLAPSVTEDDTKPENNSSTEGIGEPAPSQTVGNSNNPGPSSSLSSQRESESNTPTPSPSSSIGNPITTPAPSLSDPGPQNPGPSRSSSGQGNPNPGPTGNPEGNPNPGPSRPSTTAGNPSPNPSRPPTTVTNNPGPTRHSTPGADPERSNIPANGPEGTSTQHHVPIVFSHWHNPHHLSSPTRLLIITSTLNTPLTTVMLAPTIVTEPGGSIHSTLTQVTSVLQPGVVVTTTVPEEHVNNGNSGTNSAGRGIPLSAPIIAGAVIGGFVLLAFLAGLIFFFLRRHRRIRPRGIGFDHHEQEKYFDDPNYSGHSHEGQSAAASLSSTIKYQRLAVSDSPHSNNALAVGTAATSVAFGSSQLASQVPERSMSPPPPPRPPRAPQRPHAMKLSVDTTNLTPSVAVGSTATAGSVGLTVQPPSPRSPESLYSTVTVVPEPRRLIPGETEEPRPPSWVGVFSNFDNDGFQTPLLQRHA
ncbi:hypothetical protein FA15DRAFT_675307 [Coprinopsis marcescibilis]|uniref:Uncharacterized protein n=1 Tax=Coprinopsis marcescibilis TaxID=230819 RepID=A0A5C3KEM3_COPMA|nr:hypothetical protein FA15DRAFT_675307 [Coprinopsis marcescibilis]